MSSKSSGSKQYGEDMVGVSFKASPKEKEILDKYCEEMMVTKTEVLRRFLRSLESKIKKG